MMFLCLFRPLKRENGVGYIPSGVEIVVWKLRVVFTAMRCTWLLLMFGGSIGSKFVWPVGGVIAWEYMERIKCSFNIPWVSSSWLRFFSPSWDFDILTLRTPSSISEVALGSSLAWSGFLPWAPFWNAIVSSLSFLFHSPNQRCVSVLLVILSQGAEHPEMTLCFWGLLAQ